MMKMTDFVDTWIKIIQADLAQQKKYGYSDFDGPEENEEDS